MDDRQKLKQTLRYMLASQAIAGAIAIPVFASICLWMIFQ